MTTLQTAGEAMDSADALKELIARQAVEIEQLRVPYFEAWAILVDGKINPDFDDDEFGIGLVHDLNFGDLQYAMRDLFDYMLDMDITPPDGAYCVNFRVTNLSHESGQMSFPETGQWDFPPHWEMDVEIIGYDIDATTTKATP